MPGTAGEAALVATGGNRAGNRGNNPLDRETLLAGTEEFGIDGDPVALFAGATGTPP